MRIEFTPSPELYPFESRWLDSSVGRVHYVDEGQGRPILLLHGNPTWSFLYRNIIGGLRGGVAEMLRQIRAAEPLLREALGDGPREARREAHPARLGMRDRAFRPGAILPRMRATFSDHVLVELPRARHYIQENAPAEIARAIADRFS